MKALFLANFLELKHVYVKKSEKLSNKATHPLLVTIAKLIYK